MEREGSRNKHLIRFQSKGGKKWLFGVSFGCKIIFFWPGGGSHWPGGPQLVTIKCLLVGGPHCDICCLTFSGESVTTSQSYTFANN